MTRFNTLETSEIDRIWRRLPIDHVWSGWAIVDQAPEAICLFRKRRNWRQFQLIKNRETYSLLDESGDMIARSRSLDDVLCGIERAPSLAAKKNI